jgi:hypothetical protein
MIPLKTKWMPNNGTLVDALYSFFSFSTSGHSVAQCYRYLTLPQGFVRKQGFIHNFSSCTSLTKVGATLTILHVYFKK